MTPHPSSVLLIDAHALIHRAFHALPPLTGPQGEPTGALYGLARILIKVLRRKEFTHFFAAFDRPEPTFRKDSFANYKAHRPKAPDELITQLIAARELFRTFGIPVVEVPKVEADDIIGTLAARFAKEGHKVTILTGDLDALQLVRDPFVVVETFKKGVSETLTYDEAAVRARYGFGPASLPDLKGLMGDASDNIPGVRGVGETSAKKLIAAYGTIEGIAQAIARDGIPVVAAHAGVHTRFVQLVASHLEDARFSRELARIRTDIPLTLTLADGARVAPDPDALERYFSRMGFESLLSEVAPRGGAVPHEEISAHAAQENTAFPANVQFISSVEVAREKLTSLSGPEEKVAYDWKGILRTLGDDAAKIAPPLFDLSVAGWVVNPDAGDYSRAALFARHLGTATGGDDAALYRILTTTIADYGLTWVFREIEMPLIPVLARLERTGIPVDPARLAALARTMRGELERLEARIYAAGGGPFNLNSPRQVAEVLFTRLKLGTEKKKRTRTGKLRTGRDILLGLEDAHPIVPLLLAYRETFKIYSSFVEPLRAAIGEDGRIHTTFLQTGTATGRLSSADPNLQNIPQESKWAKSLRRAFIAPRGALLVSFDYSQLELRLLAHVSGDAALRAAFRDGADIHTLTARKIFNITRKVPPHLRRTAKTLNFGIVYGMGPRAFAASSGLPLAEAKRFINEYFRQFPGVRAWQEQVRKTVAATGYVTNEHGRRRWFPEAKRHGRLGEVERAAINMPLQSLGADIIKIAMREVDALLGSTGGQGARMLLSIHDELLFEVPRGMLSTLIPVIQTRMETVVNLSVPLRVDVTVGSDWGTMTPWNPLTK